MLQSLLMEVTALRAKIAEMREMSLTQERDVRERVKEEYDALVHNLFTACFDIKKKFDEFKWADVLIPSEHFVPAFYFWAENCRNVMLTLQYNAWFNSWWISILME